MKSYHGRSGYYSAYQSTSGRPPGPYRESGARSMKSPKSYYHNEGSTCESAEACDFVPHFDGKVMVRRDRAKQPTARNSGICSLQNRDSEGVFMTVVFMVTVGIFWRWYRWGKLW